MGAIHKHNGRRQSDNEKVGIIFVSNSPKESFSGYFYPSFKLSYLYIPCALFDTLCIYAFALQDLGCSNYINSSHDGWLLLTSILSAYCAEPWPGTVHIYRKIRKPREYLLSTQAWDQLKDRGSKHWEIIW